MVRVGGLQGLPVLFVDDQLILPRYKTHVLFVLVWNILHWLLGIAETGVLLDLLLCHSIL